MCEHTATPQKPRVHAHEHTRTPSSLSHACSVPGHCTRDVCQGESVYRTNEVSQKIYVVKSGVVEVFVVLASSDEDGKDEEVLQFKAINGDAVGEIAFVFNMRHSNNARASLSGSAVNFELTREDFRDLLKYFPEQVWTGPVNVPRAQSSSARMRFAISAHGVHYDEKRPSPPPPPPPPSSPGVLVRAPGRGADAEYCARVGRGRPRR